MKPLRRLLFLLAFPTITLLAGLCLMFDLLVIGLFRFIITGKWDCHYEEIMGLAIESLIFIYPDFDEY